MAGINIDELADIQVVSSAGNELLPNANGSVDVEATDLDIRDLTHVSDSVKVGDGTDFLAVNADGSINVVVGVTATIKTTAETIGVTQVEIVSTPLAGRKTITIQNEGSADIFMGATGVTTATGIKISKKSSATFDLSDAVDIFLISGSAAQDVRVLEIA